MTPTSSEDGLPIVELRFQSLRNLQEELGPLLAQEGLFLRDRIEFRPSDVVRFKIMLPGDFVLVEGAGVIVWVRGESNAGSGEPAGAAMGFATLSEQGRELVEQMVETHREGGGRPFDLTRPAAERPTAAEAKAERVGFGELGRARLTVRGETERAATVGGAAGRSVAEAISEPFQESVVEDAPPLPFADDSIEPPQTEAGAVQGPESDDAVFVAGVDLEVEASEEQVSAGRGERTLDPDDLDKGYEPAIDEFPVEIETDPVETITDDWHRLEEILEPEPDVQQVVAEADEDAAVVLEPVLEAAEEYVGRGSEAEERTSSDQVGDDGLDPGPAFGEAYETGSAGYLEDGLFVSIEEAAQKERTRSRIISLLAVLIVVCAAWLAWSYFTNGWPFDGTPTTVAADGDAAVQSQGDLSGEISDAELEAVVSAAFDAVIQENETPQAVGDEAPTATGETVEAAAVAEPASVIEELRWEPRSEGTVIVIRANGLLEESRVRAEPLSSPPRILIRLAGIVEAYRPLETAVGSADVRMMRMGHHPEKSPPSQWVVLDVTGPGVTVKGVEVEGDTARILVGR